MYSAMVSSSQVEVLSESPVPRRADGQTSASRPAEPGARESIPPDNLPQRGHRVPEGPGRCPVTLVAAVGPFSLNVASLSSRSSNVAN